MQHITYLKENGDFNDFTINDLVKELVSELGQPIISNDQKWYITSHSSEIKIHIDDSVTFIKANVDTIVITHGSTAQCLVRYKNKAKKEVDNNIVQKIRETYDVNEEYKLLRLGAKNNADVAFIAYDTAVSGYVSQGTTIKTSIDGAVDTSAVDAIDKSIV